MESNWFSSKSILLILIGIMVGSLGAHLVLYNSNQKANDETLNQLQTLNQTIQEINMQVNATSIKLKQLETTVSNQNTKISTNENNLNTLKTQVSTLSAQIDLIEQKYKVLDEEKGGILTQVNSLSHHITNLYKELGVSDGYKLYLDHEIMFEYKENMNITEKGIKFSYATNLEGVVWGSIIDGEHMDVMVTVWDYDILGYYKDNIQNQLESLSILSSYGVRDLQISDIKQVTYLNHTVYYKEFTGTVGGKTINGRAGVWFCEHGKRGHELLLFNDTSEYNQQFTQYLESFRCHR